MKPKRQDEGFVRPGYYHTQRHPSMWANGSQYGPLQCDGLDYLCPECGGYGFLGTNDTRCEFCLGSGTLALDDPRVTTLPPEQEVATP